MSGGFAKIGGTHRKLIGAWAKVNGVWRKGSVVDSKINGVWREAWKNAFEPPDFLSYPATITRGDTITWTTEDLIGADYELQYRYNGGSWSASTFHPANSGSFIVSTDTSMTSLQMRVRAVAPTTHDKESSWVEGPVRSLAAQTLAAPSGLTYPTTLTRGQTITLRWTAAADVKYTLQAIYNDGAATVTVYSGFGGGSKTYTLTTGIQYTKVEFRIKASRLGYIDSPYALGPERTLNPEKLDTVTTLSAPNPYKGQTITLSWGAVTNAKSYLLEVQYNDGTWSRVYFGTNRSVSYKVSTTASGIQWRVRAEATGYAPGDWKYSAQVNIALPPLKTSTWTATLVRSWRDKPHWNWRDSYDTGGEPIDRMYQGEWDNWGNHKGVALFNAASMRSTLSGKSIERVRVYFYRINKGGYSSGQAIKLWTHNYNSLPSGEPMLRYVQGPFSSYARGEGKWIIVSNEVARRIRDGEAAGIALHREDGLGYLYMSSNIKIEVQYR